MTHRCQEPNSPCGGANRLRSMLRRRFFECTRWTRTGTRRLSGLPLRDRSAWLSVIMFASLSEHSTRFPSQREAKALPWTPPCPTARGGLASAGLRRDSRTARNGAARIGPDQSARESPWERNGVSHQKPGISGYTRYGVPPLPLEDARSLWGCDSRG